MEKAKRAREQDQVKDPTRMEQVFDRIKRLPREGQAWLDGYLQGLLERVEKKEGA